LSSSIEKVPPGAFVNWITSPGGCSVTNSSMAVAQQLALMLAHQQLEQMLDAWHVQF
jgi:hypothetical protein